MSASTSACRALFCSFSTSVELAGQLHLQLALVADDGGGLLHQRLVLALRVLDRLLDLHLGVGVLVDLGAEERHQVLPALDERVRHLASLLRMLVYSRQLNLGRRCHPVTQPVTRGVADACRLKCPPNAVQTQRSAVSRRRGTPGARAGVRVAVRVVRSGPSLRTCTVTSPSVTESAPRRSSGAGAGAAVAAGRRRLGGERGLHLLGQRERGAYVAEHVGQPGSERVADRGEQLAGRLLVAALDLRQVPQAHVGRGGHLAQRSVLRQPAGAQHVADDLAEQDHGTPSRPATDRAEPIARDQVTRTPDCIDTLRRLDIRPAS